VVATIALVIYYSTEPMPYIIEHPVLYFFPLIRHFNIYHMHPLFQTSIELTTTKKQITISPLKREAKTTSISHMETDLRESITHRQYLINGQPKQRFFLRIGKNDKKKVSSIPSPPH